MVFDLRRQRRILKRKRTNLKDEYEYEDNKKKKKPASCRCTQAREVGFRICKICGICRANKQDKNPFLSFAHQN